MFIGQNKALEMHKTFTTKQDKTIKILQEKIEDLKDFKKTRKRKKIKH